MPGTTLSTLAACLMLITKFAKFMSYYCVIIDAETKTWKIMLIVLNFVRSENSVVCSFPVLRAGLHNV